MMWSILCSAFITISKETLTFTYRRVIICRCNMLCGFGDVFCVVRWQINMCRVIRCRIDGRRVDGCRGCGCRCAERFYRRNALQRKCKYNNCQQHERIPCPVFHYLPINNAKRPVQFKINEREFIYQTVDWYITSAENNKSTWR